MLIADNTALRVAYRFYSYICGVMAEVDMSFIHVSGKFKR
jgi:hypothetical protein